MIKKKLAKKNSNLQILSFIPLREKVKDGWVDQLSRSSLGQKRVFKLVKTQLYVQQHI